MCAAAARNAATKCSSRFRDPEHDPLLKLWQRKVFDLLLAEGKIDQDTVDQMTAWRHSGFSVDRSVYLPKGDVAALERLTQHIPDKSEHLVRYYGWYSYRRRGMRAKQAAAEQIKIDRTLARDDGTSEAGSTTSRPSAWAALIQRVYETDPLICPRCGAKMRIISFIETRQRDVIEKILRGHQSAAMVDSLWEGSLRTQANPRVPPKQGTRPDGDQPRELQLVLDPEFL